MIFPALRRSGRRGFTLLEMILALAISLVLMTAVYMMLDTQFSHAKAGRDAIQEATLVRSIFARISSDVAGSLGPYDPRLQADSSSAANSTGASSSASTSTSDPGAQTSTASTPAASSPVIFNLGVQGDGSQLTLSVGRAPREILGQDKRGLESSALPKVSDLRRITYWVAEGKGLMQQEITRVTSTDIDSEFADADQGKLFAAEVKSITFQYWDGGAWTSSWNSSEPGADGDTPIGSPAAIEIVLELNQPASPTEEGADPVEPRRFRHVISLPTGNNYSTQP